MEQRDRKSTLVLALLGSNQTYSIMRRLFMLIFFALVALSARAQFVLTADGMTIENEKEYYVVDIPGKSQAELFTALETWIGGHFVSPNDVVNKSSANNQITLNAIAKGVSKMPGRAIKMPLDMNFTWQIMIKDGKIRFNVPSINSLVAKGHTVQTLHIVRPSVVTDGIFKKDGTLVDEYSKTQIENFFNENAASIVASMKDNSNSDW